MKLSEVKDSRKFMAVWGEGYNVALDLHGLHDDPLSFEPKSLNNELYSARVALSPGTAPRKFVGIDFFRVSNGYYEADIKKVEALGVGETADLTDLNGEHWVKRIE